jgi:hypothetical protein
MAPNADFEEFDLTQRIRRLREEEARLKQSVSSKEQYHKKLKDECDESSGIREKIRANIKELQRHEKALSERVASTNEAIQEISRGLPDERLKEIERRETELGAREAKLEIDLAAMADLQKSNEAVRDLEEQLRTAERTIRSLRAESRKAVAAQVDLEGKVQALTRSRQRARAKLKETEQNLADTTTELASSKREAGRLRKAIVAETGRLFAHCPNVQTWISSLTEDEPGLNWGQEVATVGADPLDTIFFDEVLKEHGYELYEAGSEEAGVMIVGRTGWKLGQLERQISARTGLDIRIYSQEMALLALALKRDPFDAPEEALMEMGRSHPTLTRLIEGIDYGWQWPFVVGSGNDYFDEDQIIIHLPPELDSPLAVMGYRVGKVRGLGVLERRRILRDAFAGKIPSAVGKIEQLSEYMEQWGQPKTSQRLWRMAKHLRGLISYNRNKATWHQAIDDWEEDLLWMEKELYPQVRFKFRWPGVAD